MNRDGVYLHGTTCLLSPSNAQHRIACALSTIRTATRIGLRTDTDMKAAARDERPPVMDQHHTITITSAKTPIPAHQHNIAQSSYSARQSTPRAPRAVSTPSAAPLHVPLLLYSQHLNSANGECESLHISRACLRADVLLHCSATDCLGLCVCVCVCRIVGTQHIATRCTPSAKPPQIRRK